MITSERNLKALIKMACKTYMLPTPKTIVSMTFLSTVICSLHSMGIGMQIMTRFNMASMTLSARMAAHPLPHSPDFSGSHCFDIGMQIRERTKMMATPKLTTIAAIT